MGAALVEYLHALFDRAAANPGADFFRALSQATFQDRRLTRDELMGYANLTFAGGRDTVIQTVSSVIAYLARRPEALPFLREDSRRIVNAGEEFFRVISPLTHIGRVCPVDTNVHGVHVPANGRASLCWASANLDEKAFEAPREVRLDRKPNPHLAFGSGVHLCMGAAHARLIVRTLLQKLVDRVASIAILEARDHVESETGYQRAVGFDLLRVRFGPAESSQSL
jgi:cytochrome P450